MDNMKRNILPGAHTMLAFHNMLVGGETNETVRFEASGKSATCHLRACYRGRVIDVTATDFFEALCQIRETLALQGLYPLCHGVSLDVYSIGSSRNLNSGLLAYRLTMGRQITQFDVVETFGCNAQITPATVAEQRDFYSQWLQSTA